MRRRPRHRGYVLLLVLAVLVIAGTVLAGAARRHCDAALAAAARAERMQLHWGMLSCQAFAAGNAERLLARREAETLAPAVTARADLHLGRMEFALEVHDEQAKANVNLLAGRHGHAGLAERLTILQYGQRRALLVRLQPAPPAEGVISKVPAEYRSHSQLFVFGQPTDLIDMDAPVPGAVQRITCWGSGRVNLARAELPVIRQVLDDVLDETRLARLRRFREEMPSFTIRELAAHLELSPRDADRLAAAATVESRCHGVWVQARTQTRRYVRLAVRQAADAENDAGNWLFTW